jgi:subtilisin family serine protease
VPHNEGVTSHARLPLTASAAVLAAVLAAAALSPAMGVTSDSPTPEPTPSITDGFVPDPSASPSLTPSPSPSPSTSAASAPATPSTSPTPSDSADRYIVVTEDRAATVDLKARALRLGATIDKTLVGTVDGFAGEMTADQAALLEGLPGVEYVEPDAIISIDAPGSAVRTYAGCTTTSLGRVDDTSSGSVAIGFPVNWFGTEYSALYVNNNGGVALDDGRGAFSSYNGINLSTTIRPLILPLFTDMDTTNPSSSTVTFGQVTDLDGNADVDAFCVNWVNVGEYSSSLPKFSAQLVIVDQGNGNTDLEFNYNTVGTPTSATNGRFVVGYANPSNRSDTWSLISSADATLPYVDGGASALNAHVDSGATVEGRFIRQIRPGAAPTASPTPSATPTPTSPASCSDSVPAGTYGCVTWGLDRLDARARAYDQRFTPAGTGSGVIAYVVDTGVRPDHTEFSGRMGTAQFDAVDNDTTPQDCHGHGTHVAGTMAGANYGVARQATVVGVRVLNCYGSGYTSDVVEGLNWIAANHASNYPGSRGVANMSLGGGATKSIDDAVQGVIDAGVPVVVAAGNDDNDAVYYSPARVADAITVAASDINDTRAWFSNYGSLVDVFAPGVDVLSASIASTTATATYSGTSMASPHVAGAVAIYLGLNPAATTTAASSAIASAATSDVVSDPAGAVNRLLYARSFAAYSPPPGGGSSGGGSSGGGSSGGGSSGGGSSGGGSSGGGSSGGGSSGGGSLQEITEVRPAFGPVSGGNVVAIIGYGFTGASSVTIGGRPASFKVVNDATVEVTVPPGEGPGSADVAVNLSATRGRAFAPGGYVYRLEVAAPSNSSPGTSSAAPATASTDVGATAMPVTATVRFSGSRAALSTASKAALRAMAADLTGASVTGSVRTFSDTQGSSSSTRLAKVRAKAIVTYLRQLGVEGKIRTTVTRSSTPAQRTQLVVRLTPNA